MKYLIEGVSVAGGILIVAVNLLYIAEAIPLIGIVLNIIGALIALVPPVFIFYSRFRKAKEIDQQFINRYLNEGFSGGEKKRMEVLQMLMLKPAFAVLDETDSGLDIDALKIVAKGLNQLRSDSFGALIITHYQRILGHVKPDIVHIMYNGRIVTSGGDDLAHTLEAEGYDWVRQQYGSPSDQMEESTAVDKETSSAVTE